MATEDLIVKINRIKDSLSEAALRAAHDKSATPNAATMSDIRMSPAIGEFAVTEAHRLRQFNVRLLVILRAARIALEDALVDGVDRQDFCPRCEQIVRLIDEGETCAYCKLVL